MLDPRGRAEVMDTIEKLREKGMTTVFITHYMNEAVHADRVIVMNDGKIEMDGTPREVFSKVERLREIGLDVPQATELVHLLRGDGYSLPSDLIFGDETADAVTNLFENL